MYHPKNCSGLTKRIELTERETKRQPLMAGRKKPGRDAQSANNSVTISLTQKADDISRIIAARTGVPRAKVLWYLLVRGMDEWVKDDILHDPSNTPQEVTDRAADKVLTDPQYLAALNRLKAEIGRERLEWEEGDGDFEAEMID